MRTDQTWACARCGARFAALLLATPGQDTRRCPECDSDQLLDLTIPVGRLAAARAGFKTALETEIRREPLGSPIVWFLLLLETAAGLFVLWRALVLGFPTGLVVFGLLILLPVALITANRVRLAVVGTEVETLTGGTQLHLLAAPPSGSRRRAAIRGRVCVAQPIHSPIAGTPCAVYRLTGHSVAGPFDDGGGTSFDVLCHDGELVRVELGHATIDLVVEAEPAMVDVSEGLTTFLVDRGARIPDGRVELAETILADGDAVEVAGAFDLEPVPAGYREVAHRKVFRDRPGSPLIIRRPRRVE